MNRTEPRSAKATLRKRTGTGRDATSGNGPYVPAIFAEGVAIWRKATRLLEAVELCSATASA